MKEENLAKAKGQLIGYIALSFSWGFMKLLYLLGFSQILIPNISN
jgi:hypothetical protein